MVYRIAARGIHIESSTFISYILSFGDFEIRRGKELWFAREICPSSSQRTDFSMETLKAMSIQVFRPLRNMISSLYKDGLFRARLKQSR